MAETRKGEVTFRGKPVTLVGPKLKPGDKAPDFKCVGAGLAFLSLDNTAGKARLFNVVPSLDTPVCNKQTKRFAEELKDLGDKVAAYTVSTDLPFAQARFCTEAKISRTSVRFTVSCSISRTTSVSSTSRYSTRTSQASSWADSMRRRISSSIEEAISSE